MYFSGRRADSSPNIGGNRRLPPTPDELQDDIVDEEEEESVSQQDGVDGSEDNYLSWGRVKRRFTSLTGRQDETVDGKNNVRRRGVAGTVNKAYVTDTNSDREGELCESDCDGDSSVSYENIRDEKHMVYNQRHFEGENEKYGEMAFMRYHGRVFMLLVRFCCAISVLSVCMNTPITFIDKPALKYVTLGLDIFITCVLVIEMALKMKFKGLVNAEYAYLRSPGRLFELFMIICLVVSIVLQIVELTSSLETQVSNYLVVSFVRIPRPLLLVRTYNMSASRIRLPRKIVHENIAKVGEITLYMIYMLLVFALLGGQLFGIMDFFCVKNRKTISNVTYMDLTVPIRRCPMTGDDKLCPPGYRCTQLAFNQRRKHDEYFNHILASFLTVYEAMSLEGWSFKMFESTEVIPGGNTIGLIYFLLLVIIVGILGRNIFTAIITEAFADIRVELENLSNQVNAATGSKKEEEEAHILYKIGNEVRLFKVGEEEEVEMSNIRLLIRQVVTSKPFCYFIYFAVLLDAIVQAFLSYRWDVYWPLQIMFTVLFDIECILKIVGMGFKRYFYDKTYAFEGILCIGSTILLPLVVLKYTAYAMFQVVRVLRLPLLVGSLGSFVRRILGSSKKLGQFVIYTLIVLVMSAGIFLQLYCGFGLKVSNAKFVAKDDFGFHTFPAAFKSTFQIFMQEAWTEVMNNLLSHSNPGLDVLVYVFIILFHLLAATMLVSMFVALILDNLEMDEKVKIAKQKKIDEGVLQRTKKLPLRIWIFKLFKPHPKVVIKNINGVDYTAPVIRQTFAKKFLEPGYFGGITFPLSSFDNIDTAAPLEEKKYMYREMDYQSAEEAASIQLRNQLRKQSSLGALIKQTHLKSKYIGNNFNDIPAKRRVSEGNVENIDVKRKISESYVNGMVAKRKISDINDPSTQRKISESNVTDLPKRKISDINAPKAFFRRESRRPTENISFLSRASMYSTDRKKTDISVVKQEREEAQLKQEMQIKTIKENFPWFEKSMFIFSSRNKLRIFIHKIYHARYKHDGQHDHSAQLGAFSIHRVKKYFNTQTYLEWLMIFITWMSLIGMIVEFSYDRIGIFHNTALLVIELIFIVGSTIEIVLKLIADGLMFAPDALVDDPGDILHLLIYIVSLTYIAWQPPVIKRFSGAYALLVLRCLRPIRLITQCLPLRKEVWQVMRGYKDLLKVVLLFFILLFCFASYGVQAFSNKLKKCNDENIKNASSCIGFFVMELAKPSLIQDLNGTTSILVPRVWRNPRTFSFDDMGDALLVLLEMLSLEGWTEIRDTLETIHRPWGMIYPHLYVFLAGLVGLTLVIGIIVSNYNESRGTALLTVEQKRWKDLKSKLKLISCLRLPPVPLENKYKHALYDILLGKWYNRGYCVVILINSLTLFFGQWHHSSHHTLGKTQTLALDIICIICCVFFVIDAVIKFYAFSVKGYFISWDNRLDFLLMLAGVAFIILWLVPACYHDGHNHFTNTWTCDIARRIGIAVFLVRFLTVAVKHNPLRMLMLTIIMGFYKGFWTFCVLALIIFTYAYVGIIFFGTVKRGLYLNRKVNFESFKNAFFLLIRVMTGEDWNSLMHDAMISKPYCSIYPDKDYWHSNCGNKPLAYVYFHTFTWIITYFLLNVLTGVIIDNFSVLYLSDQDPIMSRQDITLFQGGWNVVDKGRKGFVNAHRAKFCLRLVYEKLNLNKPLVLKRMFQEIEKSQSDDKVTFHNLLFIVAYKKITNMTKFLQLEERLKREEYDRVILEEAATKVIQGFLVQINRRRSSRAKPEFTKSLSVSMSLYSIDSVEDNDDELFTSMPHRPKKREMSRKVPIVNTGTESVRRKERRSLRSDFYSWWDDEVDEINELHR